MTTLFRWGSPTLTLRWRRAYRRDVGYSDSAIGGALACSQQ